MKHQNGFNPDPIEDSIPLIAELLIDHSYLTPAQAERVARRLVSAEAEREEH